MRKWLIGLLALLGAAPIAAFLVSSSGLIPIAASSGHWPITAWFLSHSMRSSVKFHSLGTSTPALDQPHQVLKGATHYDTGCRPCHGSPDLKQPRVARAMTPHPPYLPDAVPTWESEELFYIVKHGVKFTGMPAWPTQVRDDEVWAVVAFLRRLPGMSSAEYQSMVNIRLPEKIGPPPLSDLLSPVRVPSVISEACARCHGTDGNGRGSGAFPKLAGQSPTYLEASLLAFARGERHSGIMEPIAAGLSKADIRELARYFSQQKRSPIALDHVDEDLISLGESIATHGVPLEKIPSCRHCHGPGSIPRQATYPTLAGQYAPYLELQLKLFKQQHRGGTVYAHLMHPGAERLTQEQMHALALYYASLPPAPN